MLTPPPPLRNGTLNYRRCATLHWCCGRQLEIVQVCTALQCTLKHSLILVSDNPADYTIGSAIGFGASSIVYAAVYRELASGSPDAQEMPCALKVLDLDSLPPHSLALLQRETTLMSLSKHPNVLRVRGSWMEGHKLHIALRLMNKGSAADVMHYGWPGGLDEHVILCILRQTLQGIKCVHRSFSRMPL